MEKEKEYINVISGALTTDQLKELIQKISSFQKDLWESNSLSAKEPIEWCDEIIELINSNLDFVNLLTDFTGKSIEERDKSIQNIRKECGCRFCEEREAGDRLYSPTSWDGGFGYDYVEDIQYCPICGRKLKTMEEKEEEYKKRS